MASFCWGRNTRAIPSSVWNKSASSLKGQRVAIFSADHKLLPLLSHHCRKKSYLRLTSNLLHQSEPPPIRCTDFANKQTLQAGVFFSLPSPPPLAHFYHLAHTTSANISLPQSPTVTESKLRPNTKMCTRALKICLHCRLLPIEEETG